MCSPDLDTLLSIGAPQPFVIIYELALGRAGQIVMTVVATVGLFINTSIAITAASRLIYGISQDGILPGSTWIGKVDENGQPRNAVIFIGIVSIFLLMSNSKSIINLIFFYFFFPQLFLLPIFLKVSSILLCTILPSSVAFTSLVSAGAVPTIAACKLISFFPFKIYCNLTDDTFFLFQ